MGRLDLKMIIDFETNNDDIFNYVKTEYGGREIDGKNSKRLVNIPIGFEEHFKNDLEEFMASNKIDENKYGYLIYDPRGNLI